MSEYLVNHGAAGDFGRFRAVGALTCARGERVVIRTLRGLELGVVMCPSTPRHRSLIGGTFVGHLLRQATPADEMQASEVRRLGQALFEDCRHAAADLSLPVEILDAEVLFDG